MREQIMAVIENAEHPMRPRDIAQKVHRWVCEVAIECSTMADEGLITCQTYRDAANMEFYHLYGKKER